MSGCQMFERTITGEIFEICGSVRKLASSEDVAKISSVEKAAGCQCHVQKVAAPKPTDQSVPQFGQVSPERQKLADAEKDFDSYANSIPYTDVRGRRKE